MHAFSVSNQIWTALALVYTGFVSAALSHFLLPLNDRCALPLRILMNLFLCAVVAFLIFLSLAATGVNALRFYMAPAFALGFFLYTGGIKRVIRQIKNVFAKRKKRYSSE